MKKIYQTPETVTINIPAANILAGSPGAKGDGYDPSGENLSRGYDEW